jgi:hypothetical protein
MIMSKDEPRLPALNKYVGTPVVISSRHPNPLFHNQLGQIADITMDAIIVQLDKGGKWAFPHESAQYILPYKPQDQRQSGWLKFEGIIGWRPEE